ncbi:MAG: HNH endonuclease family protein [Acidobacteriales bacterium]|nr:HNH endonuclease family protein [Terriglobales bacterium]
MTSSWNHPRKQLRRRQARYDTTETIVGRTNSLKFLSALANYANDYAAIVTPSHAKWGGYDQRVRMYVDDISQQLKMTFIRPLMLAVASRFSVSETNRAFRMLVAWVVRFLIAGGSRSGLAEKALGDAALAVTKGEIKTAADLWKKAAGAVPNDTRFLGAFGVKSLSSRKQARFILRELEAEMRGEGPGALLEPIEDTSRLTLEHILPQNPLATEGWGHFSQDERKSFCNRLGNMALLNAKDNGAIGDKPFAVKRPVIAQSGHIHLTEDVITRTEESPKLWTMAHIKERQKMMAEHAVKRWPSKPSKGK